VASTDPLALARVRLLLALGLAYLATGVPGLARMLNWFVTYFHEASHGLVAWATGGQVARMVLQLNGSGYVLASGGHAVLTLLAGYAGSFFWGAIIVQAMLTAKPGRSRLIAGFLAVFILATGLAWAGFADAGTWIVLAVLIAGFGWVAIQPDQQIAAMFLLFVGAYILVSGFLLALELHAWTGRLPPAAVNHSDAGGLEALTGLPADFFTALWIGSGGLAVVYVWQVADRRDRRLRRRPA